MIDVNKYQRSVYSQNGEDGIIEKLFIHLGIDVSQSAVVELGAYDGLWISNTRKLREQGAQAVLIEGYPEAFEKLNQLPGVVAINSYVNCEPGTCLDDLLEPTFLPYDFDLLSLDVDGNDLWIWKGLTNYQPKIVCIEYNSTVRGSWTIEYDPDFVNDNTNYHGGTAEALCKVAAEKGYVLVGFTNLGNLFFVREDLADGLKTYTHNDPEVAPGWPEGSRKLIPYNG